MHGTPIAHALRKLYTPTNLRVCKVSNCYFFHFVTTNKCHGLASSIIRFAYGNRYSFSYPHASRSTCKLLTPIRTSPTVQCPTGAQVPVCPALPVLPSHNVTVTTPPTHVNVARCFCILLHFGAIVNEINLPFGTNSRANFPCYRPHSLCEPSEYRDGPHAVQILRPLRAGA